VRAFVPDAGVVSVAPESVLPAASLNVEGREVRLVTVTDQVNMPETIDPLETPAQPDLAPPTLPPTNIATVARRSVAEVTVSPSAHAPTAYSVPFYSQFSDISSPSWQKVGCGIASLAMVISYYTHESVSVDALLDRGVAAGAYLSDAGWIHSGLIALSHPYQLDGESRSLAGMDMSTAFAELSREVQQGPVLASVHYTFDPANPIPHLVVIRGVGDGKVYYNDPADTSGDRSISAAQFQSAWKKRYIAIRPV